jgi:hypothetical protein
LCGNTPYGDFILRFFISAGIGEPGDHPNLFILEVRCKLGGKRGIFPDSTFYFLREDRIILKILF